MTYLNWKQKTIEDFSPKHIDTMYNNGYYFGRLGKGVMTQTRLVRIDLSQFELSSENKRILRKTEEIGHIVETIPYKKYHWSLGKLAKDFYDKKFSKGTFSAQKVKEIMTDEEQTNFNTLFVYTVDEDGLGKEYCNCHIDEDEHTEPSSQLKKTLPIGYAICYENENIMHYSYPFYHLEFPNKNIGMGMMIRAIEYAKKQGKQYLYLGSAQRSGDSYKLQFKGMEWFDGETWSNDLEELKEVLKVIR
ncbi:MAG: hypothetical protein HOE80_03875 [Candidatus Magasanikbacteria bacterium]|nr:hypothetical protein [Candidatus Magasanikbacteria bacterium]